ncbi:MAG: S41 family peptidase [Armatimonadota bacterium]|nr:S41 family peptidase [Armatimonadota bacterium]MDR7518409.1 S41 family peptidase [Armatimonadota bacterium]MDR7549317.1 S41 family peptidase [Armatimonadota bacterium]
MIRLVRWVWSRGLVALLLVVAVGAPPVVAASRGGVPDAGLVLEALALLRDRYVDPVDPVALLNGAIGGLRSSLSVAGLQVEVADIPAATPVDQAEAAFRSRFGAAQAAGGGRISSATLAYASIRAMTATLHDSHTGFLTPDQNRERQLKQRRQAAFSGIGVVLMPRDGRFYIRDVIPGTPAEEAGLQALDRIVRIDNLPTPGMQVEQVSNLIRGPAGTSVSLTLERPGRAEAQTVSVTRAPIQVPAIFQVRVLDGGVGYLALHQFVNRAGLDVRRALERMLKDGMRALILDVRANGGGYLHELTTVLNSLLPAGRPVYQETTRGGQTRTTRTFGVPTLPSHMPLMVLIDESTASAAELLAAALQEQGRATLLGAKTSGAVEASVLYDLSDGSALSITILRLTTGLGKRLEGVGVSPDVPVALTSADLDQGRDTQLQRAILWVRQRLGLAATRVPSSR